MQPPSLHSNFFSSLKQVEKRLKLECQSHGSSSSSQVVPQSNDKFTSTESMISSPWHLHSDQTNSYNNNNNSTLQESSDSEAPQAFLSVSPQFPQTQQNPSQSDHQKTAHDQETSNIDDVQQLMQLLGLEDNFQVEKERDDFDDKCCECEGGFYEKIVGVKGPKCEKEVERMEGWIKYFLRCSDCEEPLRLAYLLLGKATFVGSDCDIGGLEFPFTIDEFLKNDPPNE